MRVVRESVADVDAVLLLVEPVRRSGKPERELTPACRSWRVPAVLGITKLIR